MTHARTKAISGSALWATAFLTCVPAVQAQPLTASGEFLNIPSASGGKPGEWFVQGAGSTFKPSISDSRFSEFMASAGIYFDAHWATEIHVMALPAAPPSAADLARDPFHGGGAGASFAGAALQARYRFEMGEKDPYAFTAGVELASNRSYARTEMVWAWWDTSGRKTEAVSPFFAATRKVRSELSGKPLILTYELGVGWGRFKGYGPITGKLPGLFGAVSASLQNLTGILEMDGRDLNAALQIGRGPVHVTIAALQLEHVFPDKYKNKRPIHAAVGVSYHFGQ